MYRYRVIACLVAPEVLLQAGMWPDVPMSMVARGDVVRMRIADGSGAVHSVHLRGHHAVVLSPRRGARDGQSLVDRGPL
ncbi:hypothetical protein [Pseudonocardia sp. McavD-2-B]|uniref:hypothetical protein n=1 Tax=Pseudonocardia sp. McavD-2-B TaxID=2954499 RepID=UPI002097AD33|nr:hypothetical protein [Pseudonocardia sp. McavD-2-B]MCO7192901.1 hypothetical protein [Pseudonocardia sp. McavD-2-B]